MEHQRGAINGFANVVFPTLDLGTGVTAWTAADGPLVFWEVDDIEEAHRGLSARGATPLAETSDGSLAELGTAEVTNGDPETGIVDVPGGRLAVVRVPDGNYLGLSQRTG